MASLSVGPLGEFVPSVSVWLVYRSLVSEKQCLSPSETVRVSLNLKLWLYLLTLAS